MALDMSWRDYTTRFFIILPAYCLLQVLFRVVISRGANLDEAGQLLLSQSFAFGYTYQPPLYTWLQMFFFAIFGINVFSLALLKNLLLCGTYIFLFLAARLLLRCSRLAFLTPLSLWLIPQIAFESYRDLTHSVLVTSVSSATLYVLLKLLHTGRTRYYAILGTLLGLGVLSNYPFVIFAFALLGAACGQRELRSRLLDWRMTLTFGVAALLVLPHLLWVLYHPDIVIPMTIRRLGFQKGTGRLARALEGLLKLIWATVRFLTPLWLVYLLLFPRAFIARYAIRTDGTHYRQLLERFFLLVFGVLVAGVVVLGVAHFKDRWMQPFLFLVPLYAGLRLQGLDIDVGKLRVLARVVGLFGLLALLSPLAHVFVFPLFGTYSRLHIPFAQLAAQMRAAGFTRGTIATESLLVAGNLRLVFQDSRVVVPGFTAGNQTPSSRPGGCLVVWDARNSDSLPEPLQRFLPERLSAPLPSGHAPPRYVEARLRYSDRKTFRLGVLLFPGGLGDCR